MKTSHPQTANNWKPTLVLTFPLSSQGAQTGPASVLVWHCWKPFMASPLLCIYLFLNTILLSAHDTLSSHPLSALFSFPILCKNVPSHTAVIQGQTTQRQMNPWDNEVWLDKALWLPELKHLGNVIHGGKGTKNRSCVSASSLLHSKTISTYLGSSS